MDSKKDKKSNDCAINDGKMFDGNKIPIKIDFEKSGLGKNSNPIVSPIIIEI